MSQSQNQKFIIKAYDNFQQKLLSYHDLPPWSSEKLTSRMPVDVEGSLPNTPRSLIFASKKSDRSAKTKRCAKMVAPSRHLQIDIQGDSYAYALKVYMDLGVLLS